MRKYLFFMCCLLVSSATYAQDYAREASINPKLGINTSRLSTDPKSGEMLARVGYQFGLDARIGERVYFQPGLFYFKQSSELKTTQQIDNNSPQQLEDELNRQGLQVLTQAGAYIVDNEGFKFRFSVGPAVSFLTTVEENEFNLERDDFKGTNLTGNVGLGIDIFPLTLDYNYEFGLSDVFDNDTFSDNFYGTPRISRNTINLGFRFDIER